MITPKPWHANAATRVGCTVEEYRAHLAAGELRCSGCKTWHDASAFGKDRSRATGRNPYCHKASAERQAQRERTAKVLREAPKDGTAKVLADVYDMLRAKRPHAAIAEHIVATVGRP